MHMIVLDKISKISFFIKLQTIKKLGEFSKNA